MDMLFKHTCFLFVLLSLPFQLQSQNKEFIKHGHVEGIEPYEYGNEKPYKSYHYGTKDFKRIVKVNEENLAEQYHKAYKALLENPAPKLMSEETRLLADVKAALTEDKELTVEKYFILKAAKLIDPTDRKKLYVVTLASRQLSEGIDFLNKVHNENLFGSIQVYMIRPGKGAENKENLHSHKADHAGKIAKMGSRAIRFPVGLDTQGGWFSAMKAFREAGTLANAMGPTYVINRKGSLIWMGKAKNLQYYWDSIKKGEYTREDFLKARASYANFKTYKDKIGSFRYRETAIETGKKIALDLKKAPELSLEFAGIISRRTLFMYRDQSLAHTCVMNADLFTGSKFPEIIELAAHSHYESGNLVQAIAKLTHLKSLTTDKEKLENIDVLLVKWKKTRGTMGASVFHRLKKAQEKLSKELWPMMFESKADKANYTKTLKEVYTYLRLDPHLASNFAFKCYQSKRIMRDNKGVASALEALIKSAEATLSGDLKKRKKEDHIILAAKAYMLNYKGKKKDALILIEQAIKTDPNSKNVRYYRAMAQQLKRAKQR